MASALRVTLMLVDDHPLVAEGFKALLEPEFRVVAVVHEPDDVPEAYRRLRPDIVALDIALPGKSGLQLATELLQEWPDARIVMLTMHGQQDYVDRARELGARGFVLKLADVEELRSALRTIFAGGEYFANPTPVAGRRQRRLQLTGQQTNVLRLVGQGCTSAEIGQQLEIDIRTVEYHRAAIKKALGLTSNAALVRYALTDGLAE
jgi:two-component system, NarL family, nitrate/nitrite response regulator NarL